MGAREASGGGTAIRAEGLLSPVSRYSLLLGLMAADLVLVVALCIPVLALGFILGGGFATGPLGVLAFLLLSGLWGLAFTGFPYAIALRTGNPAAVNSSFILFFPFAFLTTTFPPQEAPTGWLATVAVQPGDVPSGGPASPDLLRLGPRRPAPGLRRPRPRGRRLVLPGLRRPAPPRPKLSR